MNNKSIGFIGGGRITRIILKALDTINKLPRNIIISDTAKDTLEKLLTEFPSVKISKDNSEAAKQDIVFISLHPPVIVETLSSMKSVLQPGTILVSLAPKISIEKIESVIGKDFKIARMIPNAPSIVHAGYNPVCFSESINQDERTMLNEFFHLFGMAPEVSESKLEAYAILCAMGPTYFWFQLNELKNLGISFGLTKEDVETGLTQMMKGTIETLFNSASSYEEVSDLIPVKPLADFETEIKTMYQTKLNAVNERIKAI